MFAIRSFLLALLLVPLGGCLSVTSGGLATMPNFNPLHMNPADLGAGLGVPDTIRLADGDAIITMTYQLRSEPSLRVNERFLLELSESVAVAGTLSPDQGERIYIGRLSRLDSMRMKDVQKRILGYESEGLSGRGSFSISLRGGCTTAPPLATLPFRTFVKTGSDAAYVEMTRRSDLVASFSAAVREEFLQSFRGCGEEG